MHLEDRYKLSRLIGRGSMAEVWAALDRPSGSEVAIKVVSELLAISDQARRRFEREMRSIGSIHHPNVVSMLGHGQVGDGRPFLVMELVEGETFADYLQRHPVLGARSALAVASQILEGLEAAHELGIIHRDLKPANIFLAQLNSGKRRVKILDFGVAHTLEFASTSQPRLTTTGSILGSPRYMSLEVAKGSGAIDARADIFGVGAIVYHALTGGPPFEGDTIGVILNKIFAHEIQPVTTTRPDLPERLVRFLERALAHKANHRFLSAVEMRREVNAILESL
jgi:serine/threonine-protein kinase